MLLQHVVVVDAVHALQHAEEDARVLVGQVDVQ